MPTHVPRQGANLATGGFIPEIWSKHLNAVFYAKTWLPRITNSTWEGEIKQYGSTVNIRLVPQTQVNVGVVGRPITYQNINDDYIQLLINKTLDWAITRSDIDKIQEDIDLFEEIMKDGAIRMKIEMEKEMFSAVYADAGTALATIALDETNVVKWLRSGVVQLNKNNAPTTDRWAIVTPEISGLLAGSDLKAAFLTNDTKSVLREAFDGEYIGKVYGLEVFESNNLTEVAGEAQCLIGQKSAITFASQMDRVTRGQLPDYFAEYVRSQNLYGYKVVKPEALVHAPATLL